MQVPAIFCQWPLLVVLFLRVASFVQADCNAYTPAFPLPRLDASSRIIQRARKDIEAILQESVKSKNTTSFSIAVTSSTETLFEVHHTAIDRDEQRPGAKTIDGTSCYRIASCTKAFTVLALLQQQKAGKLNLDDPINKYIAELNETQKGTLPWKDITLRSLATQLSGIPRDIGQADELVDLIDPTAHGFPPLSASEHREAQCDSIVNFTKPCMESDLLTFLKQSLPIFPPKQQSTYSNMNYELLALALENITATPYETLIENDVLSPLDMTSTTFTRPSDSVAALPKNEAYYWDVVMGIQNPTGGLYSSSTDLAKFLRYILTHYNGLTPALNWLQPSSYSTGMNTFTGMPWEIFRTTKILEYTNRPVTFVTKGGGLPGYTSYIVTVPDYDFGFVILVAGDPAIAVDAKEYISIRMTQAADEIAQSQLKARYPGTWSTTTSHHHNSQTSKRINSSITFTHSLRRGLWVENWISNGTDILSELGTIHFPGITSRLQPRKQYLQLIPTLLFIDEKNQQGEIWRLIGHQVHDEDEKNTGEKGSGKTDSGSSWRGLLRDDFCITDIDGPAYGGRPANEVVFWDKRDDGTFGSVELTGFRIRMDRNNDGGGRGGIVSDGLEGLNVQT